MKELFIDPARLEEYKDVKTGLLVRAKYPGGKIKNADIVLLTSESLLAWLRSRDGDNPYAEDVVGILLGHGHLHDYTNTEEQE